MLVPLPHIHLPVFGQNPNPNWKHAPALIMSVAPCMSSRTHLYSRGLDTKGLKAVLVKRLNEALAAAPPAAEPDAPVAMDEDTPATTEPTEDAPAAADDEEADAAAAAKEAETAAAAEAEAEAKAAEAAAAAKEEEERNAQVRA